MGEDVVCRRETGTATLLKFYLFIQGRNMINGGQHPAPQPLIGFDIGTGRDPYRNFLAYTSFQELATNIFAPENSHYRQKHGCGTAVQKIGAVIASDEARHAKAHKKSFL